MSIPLGIIFGIIAMIGWGVADFFAAKAVRKTGVLKTFLWSQIIGLILFFIIFSLFFKLPLLSFNTIGIISIAGFLGVISWLAFYKGMQIGKVSIVSPIAACWAVVTVILSLIFLNEKLTMLQAVGVGLAILGAVMASFKLHDLLKLRLKNIAIGVEYAIIALLGWGVYFVLIGFLAAELKWFLPIFLIKTATVFYLFIYSGVAKKNISFPKNAASFILLIGILEFAAFLSYGLGISYEYTAVVAPIGAAFPMVTVILARIFFKETLELNQKIGIVSVLAGLVLLSI
ncbi:MAG: DMT family transporter [Candidatus Woesearchaeota archaeon]|nr:DMT family transporter [Candidatus Woesearchaeota archaeon]